MSVRRLVILGCLIVAVAASATPAAAAKDYRAERYHARIVVEPNGALVVTETIRFVFGADSFTYVYRELPSRKTDGILVLGATMDGQPMAEGKQAGEFEIKKADEGRRRVVWHFPALANVTRTFTLTYRAEGVVWQDTNADVLAWTLLPTKHEYSIECASGEVEYPASARLLGGALFAPPATESQVEGQAVRFLRCPFERDRSWVVTMRFAPRTLAAVAPAWQERERLNRAHAPLFLGLAALLLFAGAGGFLFFALNHGVAGSGSADQRQTTPPDELPPALAGALIRTGARAAWADALGAVLDLARRGAIRIETQAEGGLFRKHDVHISAGPVPRTLAAHERTLLDLLFNTNSGPRPGLSFTEMGRTFSSTRRWKRLRRSVTDDMRAARLLDPERERTRGRVTAVGLGIMLFSFVGFALSVAFLDRAGDPLLALPIAVLIVGILGLVIGATYSPLSDEGRMRADRWKAFRHHLGSAAEQARGSAATRDSFERLLPYAAAFGIALAWAKRLEKQGVKDGPSWLYAFARDGAGGNADIGATIAVLSAGSSAGAHAGAGAAGAAGAAGGGSSGAG